MNFWALKKAIALLAASKQNDTNSNCDNDKITLGLNALGFGLLWALDLKLPLENTLNFNQVQSEQTIQ